VPECFIAPILEEYDASPERRHDVEQERLKVPIGREGVHRAQKYLLFEAEEQQPLQGFLASGQQEQLTPGNRRAPEQF
jgi:hypothetical protein